MRRRFAIGGLVLAGLLMSASVSRSEDSKPATMGGADMQAQMKEWAKWAAPSDMHKQIEKLAGNWSVATKMWMDPSAPPMESKGSATNVWVLGGRWLKSEYKGEMMGMPFEGVGMLGYDNFKKAFISTWVDNMSTAMMQTSGTANAAGTELNLAGTMDEPMTGERNKAYRNLWKLSGPDMYVIEAYDTIPGRGEVRVMELTFTRVK